MARLGKYGSSMCHFTMPTGDVASDVVVAFVVHPRQNKSADQVVEVKWHTHTHTHTLTALCCWPTFALPLCRLNKQPVDIIGI